MICPICLTDMHPGPKDYLKCPACNLYRKEVLPKKKDLLNKLRKCVLRASNSEEGIALRLKEARRQLDICSPYLPEGSIRYFDVGAAAGFMLKEGKERGWIVDGNEVCEKNVILSKKVFDIDIRYGFLEDFEYSEKYHIITMWNTLEHLLYPYKSLKFCYSMLEDRGIISIEVPIKRTDGDIVKRYEAPHMTEFNEKNIDKMMQMSGYEVIYSNVINKSKINIIGRKYAAT